MLNSNTNMCTRHDYIYILENSGSCLAVESSSVLPEYGNEDSCPGSREHSGAEQGFMILPVWVVGQDLTKDVQLHDEMDKVY